MRLITYECIAERNNAVDKARLLVPALLRCVLVECTHQDRVLTVAVGAIVLTATVGRPSPHEQRSAAVSSSGCDSRCRAYGSARCRSASGKPLMGVAAPW
ncbi:MAG: hypothetical protein MZV63_53180 [Marinilabiliales bacterium]|nr:hypothetical protein [Marinilabiliales bacterium]